MQFRQVLVPQPTDLPDLLQTDKVLKLLPAAEYDKIPKDTLIYWCSKYARYGLPTQELIVWLRDYIGDRHTIEIGAGNGDLAYHLNIRATDSKMQQLAEVKISYAKMAQPVINYPNWVEKLDAAAAIIKYRPQVVIGSWITHWIDPNKPVPEGGGNIYGVKEDELIASGITYIMIGHRITHHYKPILQVPHHTWYLPFLRSRTSGNQYDNCIHIWNEKNN
jgi:hypothetical protein